MTTKTREDEYQLPRATRLFRALDFARTVIQTGELWTEECERVINGALASMYDPLERRARLLIRQKLWSAVEARAYVNDGVPTAVHLAREFVKSALLVSDAWLEGWERDEDFTRFREFSARLLEEKDVQVEHLFHLLELVHA